MYELWNQVALCLSLVISLTNGVNLSISFNCFHLSHLKNEDSICLTDLLSGLNDVVFLSTHSIVGSIFGQLFGGLLL